MRSNSDIDRVLLDIAAFWKQLPFLRLGQLLTNALGDGCDMFYVEDEDLVKAVKKFLGEPPR